MSAALSKREWAAYVRVSDTRGREGDSFHSPKQQEEEVARRVEGKVVKVFTDLDKTGTNMNRPELMAALEWLEENPTRRGIGVYDYSRLSRRMRDTLELADRINRSGGALMSVKEDIDTSTANGEHMFHTFVSMHHLQARMIGERWQGIQKRRLKTGIAPGGGPRFGYRLGERVRNAAGKTVEESPQQIDPVYGPILKQMYKDFINGMGVQRIAKNLNDKGIPTPRGKEWGIASITRTLDSGWGAGLIVTNDPNGRVYHQGNHEPVISKDEWDEYLRIRESRKTKHPKLKAPRWFLAGITRCGLCGTGLIVNSYTAKKSQAMCSRYKQNRTCPGVWITRPHLENQVGLWLGGRVEEWAARVEEVSAGEGDRAEAAKAVKRVEDELRRLRKAKVELLKMRSRGDMDEDEYQDALRDTVKDIGTATVAHEAAVARRDALDPHDDIYELIARGTPEDMTPAEWNNMLSKIIDRIDVTKEHVVIHPHRGQPTTYRRTRRGMIPA